jgi:hypothetical protein
MLLLLPPASANAASLTVDSFEDRSGPDYYCTNPAYKDKGLCTLRIAIRASNRNGQWNNIYLQSGHYVFTSELPPITSSLFIQGESFDQTFIECKNCSGRIFLVEQNGDLGLFEVTIQGGYTTEPKGGGGIYNAGYLQLHRCVVENNTAHQYGGGIANHGQLELSHTTVRHNNDPMRTGKHVLNGFNTGGGLYNAPGAIVWMWDSTISGNMASHGGGITNEGESYITNSTISGNDPEGILNKGVAWVGSVTITANNGGVASEGDFNFWNTIILGNSPECTGTLITLGGNLLGWNCNIMRGSYPVPPGMSWPGDQTKKSPGDIFEPGIRLADNGGPTCTHALAPTSLAINNAWKGKPGEHPFACERYDQRGTTRGSASTGLCDIGAFERSSGGNGSRQICE